MLRLPAIAEEGALVPIGPGQVHHFKRGDLLHPEREPEKTLDELKAQMGSAAFSAQYLQDPAPAEGAMIKTAWLQRYNAVPEKQKYDMIVQSWDTASKSGEFNDYSVCTTWLVRKKTYYLIDLFRRRLDYPDLRKEAISQALQWQANHVLIEDKGSGIQLIQDLRAANGARPIAIQPEHDKTTRMWSQCAKFESGQVLLPQAAPWLGDLVKELLQFPNGRYDDQADSLSQFLIWAGDRPPPANFMVRRL